MNESKMIDMAKMLRKRKWTGAEIGRLELANASYAYKDAIDNGKLQGEAPIPSEQFTKMLATLTDPEQGDIYNGYIAIHKWINETMQMAQTQLQQTNFRYYKYSNNITNALIAEDLYKYIAQLPYMMTEKEYKDTVDRRTDEILHPDGEQIAFNVFQLIFEVLEHYLRQLREEPEKENPLFPLKEKLELEPVTDKRILDNYNKVMGRGYYELPDGTRSDKVSDDEWEKKANPIEYKRNHGELTEEEEKVIVWGRQLKVARTMYEEEVDQWEAIKKRNEEEQEQGISLKAEWHLYDNPPEDLNKWQVLEAGDIEQEYYPYFDVNYEEGLEYCKAFKKEFPTVAETLLEDMGKHYPELEYLSKLPVEKWLDVSYSWEEMYKMDFYDFKETFTDDTAIFDGNRRALLNGIAIVKPTKSLLLQRRIDEKGYYKPPELWEGQGNPLSLEQYFPESENHDFYISEAKYDRNTMLTSLYFLRGYNKILDLIADMYKVEEVKVFKVPTNNLETQIEALGHSIRLLYGQIKGTDYEDKELKEKKLKVLKDYFQPVDLSILDIPKAKITQAKKDMKDFKAFRGQATDPYITLGYLDPEKAQNKESVFVDWDEITEKKGG